MPSNHCYTRPPGMRTRSKTLLLGLGIACVSVFGHAALTVSPPGTEMRPRLGDDELNIDNVFHSHLPTTLEEGGLRISLNPRLGDWQKRDHMRVVTGLRYGMTDRTELSLRAVPYFSHGQGAVPSFDRHGLASLRVGAKVNLGESIFPGCETAAGFDYEFPTGHPPAELTDGLRHFRPYLTFSRRFKARPNLRIFAGVRLDLVEHTTVPGQFAKNALRDSSVGVTGGWVLDRDRWHYTLEVAYDTTRVIGRGSEDVVTIRPGVIWEVPRRGNPLGRSIWMMGLALNSSFGPGGSSLGASFKVRFNSDLGKFRRVPSAPVEL